jgi:hypothetical protein
MLIVPLVKTEAFTKLVESVSRGMGKLYEPTGIVRKAKAEAEASLILAQADIDKHELAMRAAQRWVNSEMRRQANIEAIANKAVKELPETVNSEPVSEDWMAQFFDGCQDVGEEEMQKLWARVLAGEVAKPGAFSRRTLQTLKMFDRSDAQLFVDYYTHSLQLSGGPHMAFSIEALYKFLGSNTESHLVDIGLLQEQELVQVLSLHGMGFSYFGAPYVFKSRGAAMHVNIPVHKFSRVGEELSRILVTAENVSYIEELNETLFRFGATLEKGED